MEKQEKFLLYLTFNHVTKEKYLGKLIRIDDSNFNEGDITQIKDTIRFKLCKNEKIPLRIQISIINTFIVGRIGHLFLSTNDRDDVIKEDYIKVLME